MGLVKALWSLCCRDQEAQSREYGLAPRGATPTPPPCVLTRGFCTFLASFSLARFFCVSLLGLTTVLSSFPQEREIELQARPLWKVPAVEMGVTLLVRDANLSPKIREEASLAIENALPGMALRALSPLTIDSASSFGDWQRRGEKRTEARVVLSKIPNRLYLVRSEENGGFYALYHLPLFPHFAALFVQKGRPPSSLPPADLSYEATKPFTGLLIYAKGEIPLHGKKGAGHLTPALFPKLYTETMEVLLDRSMVTYDFLVKWGVAAYASVEKEARVSNRIGENPLRTMAYGLFGGHSTDLVLPDQVARRLLASEPNRKILREGRVVILSDLEVRGELPFSGETP